MDEHLYPILEFDPCRAAKISPKAEPTLGERLVICFFPEVIEALLSERKIFLDRVLPGENPVSVYRFADSEVQLVLGARPAEETWT